MALPRWDQVDLDHARAHIQGTPAISKERREGFTPGLDKELVSLI